MEEKDKSVANENATQDVENESNAARRLRLLGIENDDKIHDEDATIKKGNFFQNLWYQHKWAIIIGAILLATLIIFCVSIATQPKYDMYISYTGPLYVDYETKNAIDYAFMEMSKDYNGDGEELLNFASITYQNEEQRKQSAEEMKDLYGGVLQDHENSKALDSIRSQMLSGVVALYLMDEKIYEEYSSKMMNVSQLLGKDLDKSIMAGENGVYFKKTDFYRHMSGTEKGKALKNLPDDTVLCLMPKLVSMDKELHESSKDLYIKILSFEIEK